MIFLNTLSDQPAIQLSVCNLRIGQQIDLNGNGGRFEVVGVEAFVLTTFLRIQPAYSTAFGDWFCVPSATQVFVLFSSGLGVLEARPTA